MAPAHMHKLALLMMLATATMAAVTGELVSRGDKESGTSLGLDIVVCVIGFIYISIVIYLICTRNDRAPGSNEPPGHAATIEMENMERGETRSAIINHYSTPGPANMAFNFQFDESHSEPNSQPNSQPNSEPHGISQAEAEDEAEFPPRPVPMGSSSSSDDTRGALPSASPSIGLPRGVLRGRRLSNRVSISHVHQNRPSTIHEVSTTGDLTPPASPTPAIRNFDAPENTERTVSISQEFSHSSLVPAPLTVRKQRSVKESASPVGTGIGEGIDEGRLRRTLSSPASMRENTQSLRATSDDDPSASAENEPEELEYLPATVYVPPPIPERSHRRSSQGSRIASSRPLVAKDLPPLPPRTDRDTLPSQSHGYIPHSYGHRSGLNELLFNTPPEARPARPLFPATSSDASRGEIPAAYASSQCLPNAGSSATLRSVDSGDGDGDAIAGSGPRPRRGNLPRDDACPDLAALRDQQQREERQRQRQRRGGEDDDDDDDEVRDEDEGESALFDSGSDASDFDSNKAYFCRERK